MNEIKLIVDLLLIASLFASFFLEWQNRKRVKLLERDIKASTDRFISGIGAAYIPACKGSMCDATPIPANGVLYKTVNNNVAWLKVRTDGNPWIFVKMADTKEWAPMVKATMQDIADALASKIPDDQALAIKADEYRKQLKDCGYASHNIEQMVKTYSPL